MRTGIKGIVLCLFLAPALSYSQGNILAVMSGNNKIYQAFYASLVDKLLDDINLTKINAKDINNTKLDNYNIIILVGHKAATLVPHKNSKSTYIYSLIPDNEFSANRIRCINTSCYKVYINQPISRYIALFKVLFPERKNLAFASTQTTTTISRQLKTAAGNNGFTYKEIKIEQDSNIARTLIHKLDNSDVLLALPDPSIYNPSNAKSIILSSYHKNVPIIAYSKSFAKAGALISLYSSIDNIADKTATLTNQLVLHGQQSEKEYYPSEFSIEINSAVARSLNVDIDSKNTIKRKIK